MFFFFSPAVYRRMPSAAVDCQSSPGNSLGKYPPWWQRYGECGFDNVEERDVWGVRGFIRGGRRRQRQSDTKPTDVGEKLYYTIQSRAKSITHPPARRSTCSTRYVNHAAAGVIGDAEYANCRRSTTRIYRVDWRAVDGTRHVVHVSE